MYGSLSLSLGNYSMSLWWDEIMDDVVTLFIHNTVEDNWMNNLEATLQRFKSTKFSYIT